ncbi:MAG TPA: NAD-dependent epimerase/dehydratase family protein [Caulobacterales bacterium]|nr:NAD-dependent epimerase/dehydratase family protein [Caulobacterales bacterium]
MRILITGGAGCLGANIIDRWIGRGDDFLVIDNFATSRREALADAKNLEVVEGDVGDKALVDAQFDRFKPDLVLHSAASYKNPDDWRSDMAANAIGSVNVVEAARRTGAKRLVNFQTALCYGRPDTTPIPVTAPTRPFTSYGVSKTAGEQVVLNSGLNAISLRLGNITGPRLSIGPIPTFYTRLKAGKACFCSATTRDFLDMEDFFSLLDLAVKEDAPRGVFNGSTGQGHTIKDVFDQVSAILGIAPSEPPPIVPPGDDDVPVVVLDPSETEKAFGWRAKVSFAASLRNMLAWYDVNGVKDVYSHVKKPR